MEWYEARDPGRGLELLDLVERTLERHAEHAMPGTRAIPTAPEHFRRLLATQAARSVERTSMATSSTVSSAEAMVLQRRR